jgi:hypothetical protein
MPCSRISRSASRPCRSGMASWYAPAGADVPDHASGQRAASGVIRPVSPAFQGEFALGRSFGNVQSMSTQRTISFYLQREDSYYCTFATATRVPTSVKR